MSYIIKKNKDYIELKLPYKNNIELLFCYMYIQLNKSIYSKISLLESVKNNPELMDIFKKCMFLSSNIDVLPITHKYNLIQLFTEDPLFNTVINKQFVQFIVVFCDRYEYNLLFSLIDTLLQEYNIKSQYLEASTINDEQFKTREYGIINLTYFLIELFNKRFIMLHNSLHKKKIINYILDVLDIGIINLYEDKYIRQSDLIMVIGDITHSILDEEIILLEQEKVDIVNRINHIDTYFSKGIYSITNFIDFVICNYSNITHDETLNIIYTFKKYNPFIYQYIPEFVDLAKQISLNSLTNNKQLIINYSILYWKLCYKNKYIFTISPYTLQEIELLFNNIIIFKDDFNIISYCINLLRVLVKIEEPILTNIYTPKLTKCCYILFENSLEIFKTNSYNIIVVLKFINLIDINILFSFELRNIFLESIFDILNNIFKHKRLHPRHPLIIIQLNQIISNLFEKKYKEVLSFFSYDMYSEFNNTAWNNYITFCNVTNSLLLTFNKSITPILKKNMEICQLDPISNCLIEYPIKVPKTNIIMDRYILSRWLMSKEENPFNRQRLTLSDINNNK